MNPPPEGDVLARVADLSRRALSTYGADPDRVEEDANGERRIHQGGYGDRQLFELVQNAADEMRSPEHRGGRIHVVLTGSYLYCANTGAPMTAQGAETILRMGVSRKRGGQIGRFGVGIKSVLSVTQAPEFFSRTGSFGFDAAWSAAEILRAVNAGYRSRGQSLVEKLGDTPVLRLARPLNTAQAEAEDPVLAELLAWATTVVRLPLLPNAAERLGRDIQHDSRVAPERSQEFPLQFPLFSNHVGTILIEDRRDMPKIRREITTEHEGIFHTIHEIRSGAKARSERYRVFTVAHQVSDDSRENAGELHDRSVIDVSWAVPEYTMVENEHGRLGQIPNDRGAFWAFFPTKYPTTLSGALNASWKTNEDRQNLLDSSHLNGELIQVAARLVVDSLPRLVIPEDPAAYLPLLPGRSKESPNWACGYLTNEIWQAAAVHPSVPDQDGQLRKPAEIRVHPDRLSREALRLWRDSSSAPVDWVHHSVDATTIRRGKLNHILEAAPRREPETVRTWLEALVHDGKAASSKAALRLLAHLLEHDLASAEAPLRRQIQEARAAKIVLTERGRLVAPVSGQVFRRTSDDGLADDLVYIDPEISADATMQDDLEVLGIREADAAGRFHSILDQGFNGYNAESWARFWELLRTAGGREQLPAIRDRVTSIPMTLRVKTVDGLFRTLRDCLLPGRVTPHDGSRDAGCTVDVTYHADDLALLRSLGMSDAPTLGFRPEGEAWFEEYHKAMHEAYCLELGPTEKRIQLQTVKLIGQPVAGPMHVYEKLSAEGKAAFLAAVPSDGVIASWSRQIGEKVSTRTAVPSPFKWIISRIGTVRTSQGIVPIDEAVGPQLMEHRSILKVAEIDSEVARKLDMPTRLEDVPEESWTSLLASTRMSTDDAVVGRNYAMLIRLALDLLNEEPTVRCRVGDRWEMRPDRDVAVALTSGEYAELVREGHPALLVDSPQDIEEAEYMIREWGMRRVVDVIEKRVRSVAIGPPAALTDEFPALRQRLGSRVADLCFQPCSELEEIIRTPQGTRTRPLDSYRQQDILLVPDEISPDELLVTADRFFGWGLGPAGCRAVIDAGRRQQEELAARERKEAIRQADDIPAKLALLIDETSLRMGLPSGLVDSEAGETGLQPDHRRLAQLAYGAHGDGVLRAHAKDIANRALIGTPAHFDGGSAALRFVAELGLPEEFAGLRIPTPPMREHIEGPIDFPALHDYQEEIAARLTRLLAQQTPQRAMLSLPTAAGKTRIAAEGVIRWVRESGTPSGPILWIAQTHELCEQAVQSWKFVWNKVGPDDRLVIDRLWHTNSATPVDGRPHLVVATDAKLDRCLGTEEYAWLREPSLVLVDEAHSAITPEYTRILEYLGLTHRTTERHLVGLTATPYRNDADETRRLVQRFGDRRLDQGIFPKDPTAHLQDLGVLARVEHRELIGADFLLNQDELAMVDVFSGFLPKTAEQRLGEDESRNRLLVEEIAALPSEWPILVFAASVQHAKFLAAKLNDRGIRSMAIDSATSIPERRQSIDAFRANRIRVITNYGVLSQGFDAPATRAVVIARPVFSAVNYQQMIGRGLRGTRNGGKPQCLILDVRDNIANFRDGLAFKDLEKLWMEGARD
ncbi:DEAD/DEAH box helicase [Hamadaea sp.]|uniref:DEAD/DEAH box helicase n=1 Tax=Hamadaea sp. TaxID=2024425 RepID=UPI0025B883C8|nr:DEAD/DEAH box helicase [Hamadaea sp.]